ncbi:unnamed protein product [Phytophthora lilii]|uniref:Unnamed protein product n=1 Tax=Phytophthora lilii TaxID=2077276 RepID=A0A9W7CM34_9STRA|nr:unnamed protein product [Phytophthora lilii]
MNNIDDYYCQLDRARSESSQAANIQYTDPNAGKKNESSSDDDALYSDDEFGGEDEDFFLDSKVSKSCQRITMLLKSRRCWKRSQSSLPKAILKNWERL